MNKRLAAIAAVTLLAGGVAAYVGFREKSGTDKAAPASQDAAATGAEKAGGAETLEQRMWAALDAYKTRKDRAPAQAFLADLATENAAGRGGWYLGILLREYTNFGLDEKGLDAVFAPLKASKDKDLQAMVRAWQNHVKLRTVPFTFSAPTMEGTPFDIASLRGKIVLVEQWNTSCTSCVEAMPRIHDIYRRYKDRGFEVVSVVYDLDGHLDRGRVRRIEKELGLTWTTLAAEGRWPEVSKTYGYAGAPQYMLLNRDGTLRAGTGEVDLGRNLEPLLKEMLASENGSTSTPAAPTA